MEFPHAQIRSPLPTVIGGTPAFLRENDGKTK